jgi:hypothetical protein
MELFFLLILGFMVCTLWLYALRAAFTIDARERLQKKLEKWFHIGSS